MNDITKTYATTLYAIQDDNGQLVNIKNRSLYTTRIDARVARRSLKRKDVRIVRCEFTNHTQWITAR